MVSQQNWWKDNLVSSGRKEEQIGIQLELIGQLEPVSILAFPLNDTDGLQKLLKLFVTVLLASKNIQEEIQWELLEERACLLPQAIQCTQAAAVRGALHRLSEYNVLLHFCLPNLTRVFFGQASPRITQRGNFGKCGSSLLCC